MWLTHQICTVGEPEVVIRTNVQDGVPFDIPKCWCPDGYEELTNVCSSVEPNDRPPFSGNLKETDHLTAVHATQG